MKQVSAEQEIPVERERGLHLEQSAATDLGKREPSLAHSDRAETFRYLHMVQPRLSHRPAECMGNQTSLWQGSVPC